MSDKQIQRELYVKFAFSTLVVFILASLVQFLWLPQTSIVLTFVFLVSLFLVYFLMTQKLIFSPIQKLKLYIEKFSADTSSMGYRLPLINSMLAASETRGILKQLELVVEHSEKLSRLAEFKRQQNDVRFAKRINEISEQIKHIESQIPRSGNLNRISTLENIAGGVVLEIKPMIEGIRDAILKLKSEINSSNISLQENYCQYIVKEVLKVSRVVKSLLIFSRDTENDRLEDVFLESIVDSALTLSAKRFNRFGVRIELENLPDVKMRCKPVQVTQILVSVLNNAFEAILNSKDPWIRMVVSADRDNAFITIVDSGTGLDAEMQSKVFSPFYSTKGGLHSSGLGLSVCRDILNAFGGDLYYEDSSNTTFTIKVPLAQGNSQI
jgi:C4-dicarboxylate-specific signal transduction histidine kinase